MPIPKSDKEFIKVLLEQHELDPDMLEELDTKLLDDGFKTAYEEALSEKYNTKEGKVMGYLPLVILGLLVLIGLYLIMGQFVIK